MFTDTDNFKCTSRLKKTNKRTNKWNSTAPETLFRKGLENIRYENQVL